MRLQHVIFQYAWELLCLLFAGATLIVSALTNFDSLAWLLAFYTTIGVLIASLRRFHESKMYRSFSLYLGMLSVYLLVVWIAHIMVPGPTARETSRQVEIIICILCPGVICNAVAHFHFVLRFANVTNTPLKIVEWAGWLISVIFIFINFAGEFAKNYVWYGHTWVPSMTPAYGIFFYCTSVFLTLGLIVPAIKMIKIEDRNRRIQLLAYTIGAAPVWISCWSNFLISLGYRIYPAGGIMFLMHAGIIAYAVLHYRAFPITVRIRRSFVYATCSTLIGVIYAASSFALWSMGPQTADWLYVRISLAVLMVFISAPLLSWLQRVLDSFFFRSTENREHLIKVFVSETSATLELPEVAESLCKTISTGLKPQNVMLYLRAVEHDHFTLYAVQAKEFFLCEWPDGQLAPENLVAATQHTNVAIRIHLESSSHDDRPLQLATGDESLAIPILNGDDKLGIIIAGPKSADEAFSSDDVSFCETLAASASTVIQNARSFSQARRLQSINEGILHSLNAGILLVSESGAINSANLAAMKICGTSEPFPSQLSKLWEAQPILASAIRRAIKERVPRQNDECSLEGKRESSVLFSITQLNLDDSEATYVVTLHDITEYKQMKASAERNKNLARLGEAAAGINHEIKNLIYPIRYQIDRLGNLDIENVLEVRKELQRATSVIPEQVSALEKMLSNLKNLGRPLKLRIGIVDLKSMVNAVWREIVTRQAAAGASFILNIPEDAKEVFADGSWIRQVIHNLLLNAVEATSGCSDPKISLETQRHGRTFNIKVCDNGRGIDEATLKRLFEPFFSTKGEAGTGLGLCVCRRIIELHGGRIAVESSSGQTIFAITLPQPGETAACDDPLSSFRE